MKRILNSLYVNMSEMYYREIYLFKGNKIWEGLFDIVIVKMYDLIENICTVKCASVFNLLHRVVLVEMHIENLTSHRYSVGNWRDVLALFSNSYKCPYMAVLID